jgi:hypothetical protein
MAFMESAWPRTTGIPAWAHRSARQDHVKSPFARDDDILARGCNDLEPGVGAGLPVTMPHDLPIAVQDADVQRTSVQVDPTVKVVWLSVTSHEVASSSGGCFPRTSIPRGSAEEEASISINPLELTAHSVRSAPAFGSG